jgi:2-enoate reductase
MTACDVLKGIDDAGERVVVIGGGLVGCEVALWLKDHGREVIIVEMMDRILDSVFISHANKMMLTDLIKYHNITVRTGTCVQEITESAVQILNRNNEAETLEADTVISAIGYLPDQELYNRIKNQYDKVHLIGDASKVRNIHNAIWDGYEVGRTL